MYWNKNSHIMHAIGQRTYKPTDWKSVNLSQMHQKHTVVKTALGNFQQASLAMWIVVCRMENWTQHSSLENNIWKHKGKFIDVCLSYNFWIILKHYRLQKHTNQMAWDSQLLHCKSDDSQNTEAACWIEEPVREPCIC